MQMVLLVIVSHDKWLIWILSLDSCVSPPQLSVLTAGPIDRTDQDQTAPFDRSTRDLLPFKGMTRIRGWTKYQDLDTGVVPLSKEPGIPPPPRLPECRSCRCTLLESSTSNPSTP